MTKLNEAEVRARAEKFIADTNRFTAITGIDMCGDDAEWVQGLLDLLDEKDKVIERLPVTGDGVPIFVGMEVWLPGFPKYPGFVDIVMDDDVGVNDMSEWPAHGCETIRHCTVRDPSSLYSTREAAEAARNKETTDD